MHHGLDSVGFGLGTVVVIFRAASCGVCVILGRVPHAGSGSVADSDERAQGVEQDAVELYFVYVPNLRWHRSVERLGALVIDGGAVADLAGRPGGIVVDYLLKTDV
jgi:hypothetical protein